MDLRDVFKAPAPKRRADLMTGGAYDPAAKRQRLATPGVTSSSSADPGEVIGDEDDDDDDNINEPDDIDDDERFFGDGLDDSTRRVLNIVDSAAPTDVAVDDTNLAELDTGALKRQAARFAKARSTNEELRAKHLGDPERFLPSELDLDTEIRALAVLATAPRLYREATRLRIAESLVFLLGHENSDIALSSVATLAELMDDDVVGLAAEDDDFSASCIRGIAEFAAQMLECGFLALFETAYRRELSLAAASADDGDAAVASDALNEALMRYLALLDGILSAFPAAIADVTANSKIPDLLLSHLKDAATDIKAKRPFLSPVRSYAAELLATILQQDGSARAPVMVAQGGLAVILELLSKYRKTDPDDADESEWMENLFGLLCLALTDPQVQTAFRAEEGIELMVLMLQKRRRSRIRAIQILNYATMAPPSMEPSSSNPAALNALHLVTEAQGLGAVFPIFMHQDRKKVAKAYKDEYVAKTDDEHTVSVLVNLLRGLDTRSSPPSNGDSNAAVAARDRVLRKFHEDDHAKLIQAVSMFARYRDAVGPAAVTADTEGDDEEDDDLDYIDRLDRGLFTLSQIGVLIGTLCRDSAELREYVVDVLLPAASLDPRDVAQVLLDAARRADAGSKAAVELRTLAAALTSSE
ncbi:Catenin-beta-like protein [Blastocladiella britannica]|nr:Catenin-beta-like protein [Blastocladiella britannica]